MVQQKQENKKNEEESKIPVKYKKKYAIFREKARYIVVYCVKESNSYNFFKTKRIKPNTKVIEYDKNSVFVVDIENPTYREGNTRYYCIDINSEMIHFEQLEKDKFMTSRINSTIFQDEIIMQLGKATTQPIQSKYDWKAFIFGLLIGAFGGLFGGFVGGLFF